MEVCMANKNFKTTGIERSSYALYFFGQNIFYILILMYLTTFFMDVGIPALTVSGMVLVVKIWDAINDPIFGGMVDKIKFKKGKFLPWVRISLFFIPLTTIFMFAIPSSLSVNAKVIWAVIGYILWDTAYTVCDVPIFGIVTTMTDVQQERTTIYAFGRVAAMAAALVVSVIIPIFRVAIGGWLPTVIILSLIAFFTMSLICIKAKERIHPKQDEQQTEVGIKEMFKYVKNNKYLLIINIALLINGSLAIGNSMGLYFARYNLQNESLSGILSMITLIPIIVIGLFVPAICKKIDKFKLYHCSLAIAIVLMLIKYFVGYKNIGLFVAISLISSIPLAFTSVLCLMFTPDCAEYGHYKTGYSCTGIAISLQTFSAKLQAAFSAALGSLALGLIGFMEGEGAVQAVNFPEKLWMVQNFIPMLGAILSYILLTRYKLTDHDVELMAKCNAGEITKEHAEANFTKKF